MEEINNKKLKLRVIDNDFSIINNANINSTPKGVIHKETGGGVQFTSNTFDLVSWLRSKYDNDEIDQLLNSNFSKLNEKDKLNTLQKFLNWFRDEFPYYYDRCDECHASYRDDERNKSTQNTTDQQHDDENNNINNNNNGNESNDIDDDTSDGTFLGYVYPSEEEIKGKASRTELYHCHKCHAYTRFPRFNSISSIVKLGRGRCGEYSILLYRMLRELGHETRWVVDWSDHVWVECWFNPHGQKDEGRWTHLDPCEAACDQPHLYQQWGKKQTMIIAFWLPRKNKVGDNHKNQLEANINSPLIEDVTLKYTSDTIDVIQSRREESIEKIQTSIQEVEAKLKDSLFNLTLSHKNHEKNNLLK